MLASLTERKFDIIKKLSTEVSNIIFAMLDNRSLRSVSKVSETWKIISVCERRRRQRKRSTKVAVERFWNEARVAHTLKAYNCSNLRF